VHLYLSDKIGTNVLVKEITHDVILLQNCHMYIHTGPDYDLLGPPHTEQPPNSPAPVLNIFYSWYILSTFA